MGHPKPYRLIRVKVHTRRLIITCMDIELIAIGVVLLIWVGFDIIAVLLSIKGIKENKAQTGRFFQPWGSISTIRKANIIGLIIIFIAMLYWLYNYSILAP